MNIKIKKEAPKYKIDNIRSIMEIPPARFGRFMAELHDLHRRYHLEKEKHPNINVVIDGMTWVDDKETVIRVARG